MLVAGFCPKLRVAHCHGPQPVLGGATITVFAAITLSGIQLISSSRSPTVNCTIVGISLTLGVGIASVPEILAVRSAACAERLGSSPWLPSSSPLVLKYDRSRDDSEE